MPVKRFQLCGRRAPFTSVLPRTSDLGAGPPWTLSAGSPPQRCQDGPAERAAQAFPALTLLRKTASKISGFNFFLSA